MGVIFHWFKEYEIEKHEHPISWVNSYYSSSINFRGDCDSTSHSYSNRTKLENLFEEVNIIIPNIPDEIFDDESEKNIQSLLVDPSLMSKKCQELLDSDLDLKDMEDRITWIKDLSDKGYYVAYDML